MKTHIGFAVYTLSAGIFAGGVVQAAEVGYGITAGIGYSDNIRRVPTNEESETIGSAGFNISLLQDSRTIQADVLADLAYFKYFGDTYDSEVVGNLAGSANFLIVPGRFEWMMSDNFGQVRSDPLASVTPDNRENINYFTTGPDLILPFGSASRGRISGRYSRTDYEESPSDSDRYGATASLIHDLSSASSASINVSSTKVNYANRLAPDYDDREAYLNYQLQGARTGANIDAGYSEIEQDGGMKSEGALLRLDVSRRTSPSSTLTLSAGHVFTDASDAFRVEQALSYSLDAQSIIPTSTPFVNKYAGLRWDFARERTAFGISATHSRDEYEAPSTLFDRARWIGEVHASRELNPVLRAQVGVSYLKEEYEQTDIHFRELGTSAALIWRAGRMLRLNLEYQHFTRNDSTGAYQYDENRVWLRASYGSGDADSRRRAGIGAGNRTNNERR